MKGGRWTRAYRPSRVSEISACRTEVLDRNGEGSTPCTCRMNSRDSWTSDYTVYDSYRRVRAQKLLVYSVTYILKDVLPMSFTIWRGQRVEFCDKGGRGYSSFLPDLHSLSLVFHFCKCFLLPGSTENITSSTNRAVEKLTSDKAESNDPQIVFPVR